MATTISQLFGLLADKGKEALGNPSWDKGEPYRAALGGLLMGDLQPLRDLNKPTKVDPNEALNVALNFNNPMAMSGLLGHTVWHASPYKFDKFDMSKIGTGEGAQAYGHGLYYAEAPVVAKEYFDRFNSDAFRYKEQSAARARIKNKIADRVESVDPEKAARLRADAATVTDEGAHLYKVDIPDEILPKMLDWDKPLSQQHPDVRKSITGMKDWEYLAPYFKQNNRPDPSGMNIYDALGYAGYDHGAASDVLYGNGLHGIRYLDGNSRGTGDGTYNYVLFDDRLPRILERNGQPTGQVPWKDDPLALLGLLGN